MKTKLICTLLSVLLLFSALSLLSCGQSQPGGNTSENASRDKNDGVKISDLDWYVDEYIADGERMVGLGVTNKSDYTVVYLKFTFAEKKELTEEEKSRYFADIHELLQIDDSDLDDVSDFEDLKTVPIEMEADTEYVLSPNESIPLTPLHYYNGYYYVRNLSHYGLVEPDILTVKYIKDNRIYTEYYDFRSQKYTVESETTSAYEWTDDGLEDVLPRPDAVYVTAGISDDDYFSFDVYGWSIEDFDRYVDQCKEAGFINDVSSHDGFYSADDSSNHNVDLYYDEDNHSMSGTISADD